MYLHGVNRVRVAREQRSQVRPYVRSSHGTLKVSFGGDCFGTHTPSLLLPAEAAAAAAMGEQPVRVLKRRWLMLALFSVTSMANAAHWIMYAIIANIATRYYGVSDMAINWTSIVFMAAYVPLVIPASWVIEKKVVFLFDVPCVRVRRRVPAR